MEWTCKDFEHLTTRELYDIYRNRVDVFVVEQTCPYPEVDEEDLLCYHLVGYDSNRQLMAYARIIPEKHTTKIGRILVSKEKRCNGLGKILLKKAIEQARIIYPDKKIVIQAQAYLEDFYHSFGFENTSAVYLEDGIPHIDMELM